jgi:hypothetical protein
MRSAIFDSAMRTVVIVLLQIPPEGRARSSPADILQNRRVEIRGIFPLLRRARVAEHIHDAVTLLLAVAALFPHALIFQSTSVVSRIHVSPVTEGRRKLAGFSFPAGRQHQTYQLGLYAQAISLDTSDLEAQHRPQCELPCPTSSNSK